jgi:hypothetical protein
MFGHDNQDNDQDNMNDTKEHEELAVQDDGKVILPGESDGDGDGDDDKQEEEEKVIVPAASVEPRAITTKNKPAADETDDLMTIKLEALQDLTPLVDQLDQTPEEKFRTTMMMIQASDNHALIKTAYKAAKKISSEKDRAQALLDVVNEINYFTQQAEV